MYKNATRHRRHSEGDYDFAADLNKIKSAFSDASQDLRDRAGDIFLDSLHEAKQKSKHVTNYLADRPLKSIGLAMFAGLIIGYFIHK